MNYGDGFWCVRYGDRLSVPVYPRLEGFEYNDGTGDKGEWLLEDFTVDYRPPGLPASDPAVLRMTVKASFDYDGASIPRAARSFVGDKLAHDIRVAALFHDIGYCVHDLPASAGFAADRAWWDDLIAQIIEAYGGTLAKRCAVKAAVKQFGWCAWPKSEADLAKYRKLFSVEKVTL